MQDEAELHSEFQGSLGGQNETLWETNKQGAVRYPGGDAKEEVGGPNGGEAMAGI